jgi:hypothetical protein
MIMRFPVRLLFLGASLLVTSITTSAWADVTLRGRLRERGTKTPLADTNVFLLPHKLKATTDRNGRFEIQNVPEGEATWIINAANYKKLELDAVISKDSVDQPLELYLEKSSYQVFETTVVSKQDRRDDAKKTLKASEFASLPGAGGDPIKAVQNLPGVNRPQSFDSRVIIQGSAPKDTRYHIQGHEVPIVFHFGGLSSVVMPEALDRVEYSSAGYGAEWGRANGGLVGVFTRKPRTDRLHGMGYLDIFNAGGYIEGPTDDSGSSALLGFRQSYIGQVLRAVVKNNDSFNLTVAPAFRDGVFIYDTQLSPIDQFRINMVGSQDTLEFLLKQPIDADPTLRGTFKSETSFFRLIPELTHRHGENTVSRWSLGLGRDWIRVDLNTNYFFLKLWSITARGEVEHRFSPEWVSQVGFDNRYTYANVDILLPDTYFDGGVANPFSTGTLKKASITKTYKLLGMYWRNEFKPAGTAWTLIPGIRGEHYSATNETFPLPRFASRYEWSPALTLKQGFGLYAQPPQEQETDPTYGNTGIKSPRAWHATLGFDQDWRGGGSEGWSWSPALFYKQLTDLVEPSTKVFVTSTGYKTENFNNDGRGRVYGLESQVKYTGEPWTAWISYTLSKSTRWKVGQAEYPFEYDQTHNLNLIGQYQTENNWQFSARVRYTTGSPTTPITGSVFDADNDVYIPVRGAFYSDRLDPFFQVDYRVDKKWIYDTWILSAYLDIQNVTNSKNREDIRYSYDYSKSEKVTGLPILPTLGLKGEF